MVRTKKKRKREGEGEGRTVFIPRGSGHCVAQLASSNYCAEGISHIGRVTVEGFFDFLDESFGNVRAGVLIR